MGIKAIVSFASIALVTSVGWALADDRTTANAGNTFSAVQGLHAAPLTTQEMDKIRGADNLWIWRNGRLAGDGKPMLRAGHPGFGSGFTNWIVGCGGPPQPTIFSAPSC